ncbi:MAG: nuclear transport factor 2 family protein [Pirellulaceae bacterium]
MPNTLSLLPPFNLQSAAAKVQAAEDAWNSQDPIRIAQAYSINSEWRNRDQFICGRDQIVEFLTQKWQRELDYRLAKSLWTITENRIAVRFQYEYRLVDGQWYRAYGNENWELDADGLMCRREASINDVAIDHSNRKFTWPSGTPRPAVGFEIEELR